jgi:HTH-type transcriptional regulator/antitoxin HigA
MDIKPIRTDADYKVTMNRIDALLDAEFGSQEGDELDVLSMLVDAWEQKHFAIAEPDPVEFIKNVMEFMGTGQGELATVLDSRPRASEILNRRRPLTLGNIRKITAAWHVPADALIGEYEL